VGTALRRLIPTVCGRVYFATFASHAHRIQQAIEVSRESGRRVTLLGRSINSGVAAARGLGHLKTARETSFPNADPAISPGTS